MSAIAGLAEGIAGIAQSNFSAPRAAHRRHEAAFVADIEKSPRGTHHSKNDKRCRVYFTCKPNFNLGGRGYTRENPSEPDYLGPRRRRSRAGQDRRKDASRLSPHHARVASRASVARSSRSRFVRANGPLGGANIALDSMIARREAEIRESYAATLAKANGLAKRVRFLAEIRSKEGYMAEATRVPGGWILAENHCPICAAATVCQGFCRSELDVFCTVLGDDVTIERTEHVLAGARRCAYFIRKRAEG